MRPDLAVVADLVGSGVRVLDLGCGNGELAEFLIQSRSCQVTGVEISDEGFHACIARGVPVIQADIDQGLADVEDDAYDVVVLSQTLQATRRPALVLRELMRVGRSGVVTVPNFAFGPRRLRLGLRGRMPLATPGTAWYDTDDIHPCSLADLARLLEQLGLRVERRVILDGQGRAVAGMARRAPNLLGAGAAYRVARG